MLFLLFQLGEDTYGLDVGRIAEILPLVDIKRVPGAPPGVAGAIHYRNESVPVIDLSELATGRPAPNRLSTRIVLVNYRLSEGATRLLGLIAENATATKRIDESAFMPSGITAAAAPYLGDIAADTDGLIQRLDIEHLLSSHLRDTLFMENAVP